MVFAVPYQDSAIVMDTAMSQYSYGAIDLYALKNEKLPTAGGYDVNGNLTDDPVKILESRRVLPIGFWKGAGMSLLLDILSTILSGGLSTHEISKLPVEYSMSQVFIAIDISKLSHASSIQQSLRQIIADYQQSVPASAKDKIRYPGEKISQIRRENIKQGIPVAKKVWDEIKQL
jgi:3-dehydro-L-gulonate 2-dehydrogenase